jgi:hypothetical protein
MEEDRHEDGGGGIFQRPCAWHEHFVYCSVLFGASFLRRLSSTSSDGVRFERRPPRGTVTRGRFRRDLVAIIAHSLQLCCLSSVGAYYFNHI